MGKVIDISLAAAQRRPLTLFVAAGALDGRVEPPAKSLPRRIIEVLWGLFCTMAAAAVVIAAGAGFWLVVDGLFALLRG